MENNINVILVLLFMMGMLLVTAAIMSVKQGAVKMKELLCVGGKWFRVGVFRFWQRKKCVQRRQDTATEEPAASTRAAATVDFDLILPSLEAGPVRGRPDYNPTYGYEPYWTGGDWVFDKTAIVKNATLYMCGIRCPKVYTEYGKICGRNKNYEYETFVNFCQLKNKDCSNVERWTMLYRGPCGNRFVPFDEKEDGIAVRVKQYEADFEQAANATTLNEEDELIAKALVSKAV